jgi:hypothetical protein
MTIQKLLAELEEVCDTMSQLHRELAQVQMAETRGMVEHQMYSDGTSVAARERYANFQVIDLTEDRIRLQGELNATRERQKFLLAAIGTYDVKREP